MPYSDYRGGERNASLDDATARYSRQLAESSQFVLVGRQYPLVLRGSLMAVEPASAYPTGELAGEYRDLFVQSRQPSHVES